MCGRYAASASPEDLVEELEVEDDETDGRLERNWNLAPTDSAAVVLQRPRREDRDGPAVRQLRVLTWGLVPSWAKDPSIGNRMINARSETLLDAGAYRKAAAARRCLVPADGWYEWQASPTATDAKGRPRKQPFFVHLADGHRLTFAGLYEFWRDKSRPDDDPLAWRTTFTIITTQAEPGLDRIHDRMPLVLPRERWADWLDPSRTSPDDVRDLLAPVEPGRFVAYPVGRAVGDVRNTGPQLLEPAAADDLVGVVDPMTGEVLGDPVPAEQLTLDQAGPADGGAGGRGAATGG
jgi:putative SOS response-associated peptidase YedK